MRTKEVEIVRLLMDNRDKDLSINQIAKLLKKDYKNAHNIVTRLSALGLVRLESFGRSYKVILVEKPHPLIYEAEYNRRQALLRNKAIAVMADSFDAMRSRLYVALVFGSYARNLQTRHSDIDLMFIVTDSSVENMEKEIMAIVKTLPLDIHANIFSESDFMSMKDSKTSTVGSEAMKNNIILHGIEAYHEMIR